MTSDSLPSILAAVFGVISEAPDFDVFHIDAVKEIAARSADPIFAMHAAALAAKVQIHLGQPAAECILGKEVSVLVDWADAVFKAKAARFADATTEIQKVLRLASKRVEEVGASHFAGKVGA
jgi:hypothetical protein